MGCVFTMIVVLCEPKKLQDTMKTSGQKVPESNQALVAGAICFHIRLCACK